MHSDFTPFGAYWLNHIPLGTILLSTVAFHTSVRHTEGVKECQSLPWYIGNMRVKGKTKFLLNACNISYTQEWKLVFDSLSHLCMHST